MTYATIVAAALALLLAGCLSVPGGEVEREADCCRPVDDAGCDWLPVTYQVPRVTRAFDDADRACRTLGLEPYRTSTASDGGRSEAARD